MERGRIRCLILALLLAVGTLTGCGNTGSGAGVPGPENGSGTASNGGGTGTGAKGRFVEYRVSLPIAADHIYSIGSLADGRIGVLAAAEDENRGYLCYTEDTGENFTVQEVEIPLADAWVTASAIAPDGSALLACYADSDDAGSYAVKKITPDGSVTEQPVLLPESDNTGGNYVRQMGFDASGRLFVYDAADAVLAVDLTSGECKKAVPYRGQIDYFDIVGERLFLVSEEQGLTIWQTSDGTELPVDEVLAAAARDHAMRSAEEGSVTMAFCEGMEPGSVAYVHGGGIYYHMDGGSVDEQLMDSALTTLVNMQYSLREVVMAGEDAFLVLVANIDGGAILRYAYDADISAVPESELTIYALEENALLRQAATRYQSAHPGIYVNLQVGMTGEDGVTAEDAIRTLNTEILAGNVPDILILDGLPAESYVEKGVIADISGIVNEIEQADGMFSNIKAAYEQDGAIYMLPARFYAMIASGTEKAVDAAGTLAGYAGYIEEQGRANPGQNIMQRRPPRELLWAMFLADSGNWRTSDGGVDEARIGDWLEWAGRIYHVDDYSVDEEIGRIHSYEGRLFGTVNTGMSLLLMGETKECLGSVVSMGDLSEMFGIYDQTGGTYGLVGAQEAKCFVPYLTVGMSSNPAAPEAAEEFLRLLLGSELGSQDGDGFPINRAGWALLCTKALQDYGSESEISFGMSGPDGTVVGYEANKLTEEILEDFGKLLQSLETPAMTDATIRDLAVAQGVRYVTGEVSLEDARAELLQQFNLYLAE